MAHRYGSVSVPLIAQQGQDDLLYHVGAYFQAVANAHAAAEWESVAPPTGALPITAVFTNDPRDTNFNDNKLPALFIWRSQETEFVDEAQDIRVMRGTLKCLWVPPALGKPEVLAKRWQFPWKLARVLDFYLERLRDPSYVVPGDPDPDAATMGSMIGDFAKFRKLRFNSVKPEPVSIDLVDAKRPPLIYDASLFELAVEEEIAWDLTQFDAFDGIDNTISVPPADLQTQPRILIDQDLD